MADLCPDCKSNRIQGMLLIHEPSCKHYINKSQAKNKGIEIPDKKTHIITSEPSVSELEDIKRKYNEIKQIVINALIGIDWTLKIGAPLLLWFFPAPQNHVLQVIGLAIFIFILTMVSKGLYKLQSQRLEA